MSGRDELAEWLHLHYESSDQWPCTDECVERYGEDADALLASPAIAAVMSQRVAALADDESAVERIARIDYDMHRGHAGTFDDDWVTVSEQVLRALAADLSGGAR